MSGPRVVLISDVFKRQPAAADMVAEAGFEPVERYELVHRATAAELLDALGSAWAVVAGSERYSRDLIERLPDLHAIARPGVGVDAIDLDAASRAGIAVLTTPGANDDSVADHAIALMLAVLRKLAQHDAAVRAGHWRDAPTGRDLTGLRVGILGLGAIGRAVARRLVGFRCELAATDPAPDAAFCREMGIELVDIDELAARSDVLTVHTPLLETTRALVNADVLALLPVGAILVNTSRGPVVDEVALIDALRRRSLAGAGIDVFAREPMPADHPLARLDNVVLTGHVASLSEQGISRLAKATIANLVSLASATGMALPVAPVEAGGG